MKRVIIAKEFAVKKLFTPDNLDPNIQNALIAKNKAIKNRSESRIVKFLPKISSVELISSDKGPKGNTLSILKVSANKANNKLTPPPIITESNLLDRIKINISDTSNGNPIQIMGAVKLNLLLVDG